MTDINKPKPVNDPPPLWSFIVVGVVGGILLYYWSGGIPARR